MSIHLGSGIKKERKWDIGKIVKEGFFMDSSFYVWEGGKKYAWEKFYI